jgi:NADH-quinone oxidoreductase subunit C
MITSPEDLAILIKAEIGDRALSVVVAFEEVTLETSPAHIVAVMTALRDGSSLRFENLIDVCGVDYQGYGDGTRQGPRFAVVYHLLSVTQNLRMRVRAFAADDEFPSVESVTGVWPSANWYEREAFDLYGIVFPGHPDLRRILTDYGFIGHPFRKDFPLSGHLEMRYDPDQKRVIYQPVTIEPREVTPRVLREENYGNG